MGTDAVDAAQATLAYASTLWPGMTCANIGVTLDFTKIFLKYTG